MNHLVLSGGIPISGNDTRFWRCENEYNVIYGFSFGINNIYLAILQPPRFYWSANTRRSWFSWLYSVDKLVISSCKAINLDDLRWIDIFNDVV